MHPAEFVLQKLGADFNSVGLDWQFVICVLELLIEHDPRPRTLTNPVQECYDRILESGLDPRTDSYIRLTQLLEPTFVFFAEWPLSIPA